MKKLLLLGILALAPVNAMAWDSSSFGFNSNMSATTAGATNGQQGTLMPGGGAVSAGSMEQAFSSNRSGTNANGATKSVSNANVVGEGFATGTPNSFAGEWSVGAAYGTGRTKDFSGWSQPGF